MRFFSLFAALLLSTHCLGQQADNLDALSRQIEKWTAEKNHRINNYLKDKRQALSFTSTEGDQYLLVDIDSKGNPIYRSTLNANAAITTGAAKLQSGSIGLLLEGKGLTLGIWDGGKIQTHIELGDRVISNEQVSVSDHATHVTGTLIAAGINPEAKGMAPKAKIIAKFYDNDQAEMASLAQPNQSTLLISNHSYGSVTGWYRMNSKWEWAGDPTISQDEDFRFGFYGDRTQVTDQITYLAPYYSIVWAAGNDRAETGNGEHPPDCNNGTGYDCIISDGVAKNIITVGAVDKILNYTGPGSVPMSYFSSWGPTDDGRIKPDLVGDGVNLFSLSSSGVDQYEMNSGTSMATPNVAGSLALLQELYSKLHGGNIMKAATLKAIAIHTAKETGSFPGPDYSFGWGVLDVEAGANVLLQEDGVNTMVRELTLNNNGTIDFTLSPQANQKIKASIVWTDPAGSPVPDKLDPTSSMLINDLDIKLVDDSGNEFLPWVLDPGNPSKGATKGNNARDNVEKIEFDLPAAKPYRLIVSHKGKLANDKQDFSLIVTYQSSTNVAQTYYWVGDSGDWSDPTHWSNTSGGVAVNKVPTINDYVIVDENSFDGIGIDQINFSEDQSIASLLWINSKQSGVHLNGNKISINKSLTIASPVFQAYSAGSILLSSASEGKINFSGNELTGIVLAVNAGTWTWSGSVALGKLTLEAGNLLIGDAEIKANNLISNSGLLRELTMNNSSIELTESSMLVKSNLTLNVEGSQLISSGPQVVLDWDEVAWNGGLSLATGKLLIKGNNAIDSLIIDAGTEITLASTTTQTINDIQINSTTSSPVKMISDGNALLNIANHKKFCFDFLRVTNVEATGVGVLNAGESAVLVNAKGWNAQKCGDVLFADFETKYPCQNGLTAFADKSIGAPQQWEWIFPGSIKVTGKEADFSFAEVGTYLVTLTVSSDKTSQSYTGQVTIAENSLATNQVLANSDELYSFNLAASYQWFKDEHKLSAETGREYTYHGQTGSYFVVTYDDLCNRKSEQITITGFGDKPNLSWRVYPNPANHEIFAAFEKDEIDLVTITDLLGKRLIEIKSHERNVTLPLSQLSDGIYLIEITSGDEKYRDKILVKH